MGAYGVCMVTIGGRKRQGGVSHLGGASALPCRSWLGHHGYCRMLHRRAALFQEAHVCGAWAKFLTSTTALSPGSVGASIRETLSGSACSISGRLEVSQVVRSDRIQPERHDRPSSAVQRLCQTSCPPQIRRAETKRSCGFLVLSCISEPGKTG